VLVMGQDYMVRARPAAVRIPDPGRAGGVGMMLMVSAGDLIALYMGLELQSLALYVIAAIRRDSACARPRRG
jgi:NADH-quinone oxidoreductase subunit N